MKLNINVREGLGLWCLTPLTTIFQLHFIGGGNQSTWEKNANLPQVTNKTLSHNVVSSTPCLSGI
jgi:hypothetical protein